MSKVAFIGAGSWGTALASLVASKNSRDTILWARRPELAETINLWHENPPYLPDVALPESLYATNDLEQAVSGAGVIVMAVPSHGFRAVLRQVVQALGPPPPTMPVFVSLTKGVEVETRKRMSEILAEEVDGIDDSSIAVLAGPTLAREVVSGLPGMSTVACRDEATARLLQDLFNRQGFNCYTNVDVVGCELGGAFKNVIAIAAGIADGLGYGDNTKATVMTRGLAELAEFSAKFGGLPLTFLGLAGVGDLIATCASPQSRNHFVGTELGKGRAIEEIIGSMNMVAEGVKSCKPIYELGCDAGVAMPVAASVVRICHEGASVDDLVSDLFSAKVGAEF